MHLRCWPYPWLSLSPQVVSYLVPLSFFFLLQQLATSSSDTLALSTIGLGNNWGYAPQLDSSQGNHLKLTVLFYPNVCLCKFKGQNVNYLWWQNVNKIWKGKLIPHNKYSKNKGWSYFFLQTAEGFSLWIHYAYIANAVNGESVPLKHTAKDMKADMMSNECNWCDEVLFIIGNGLFLMISGKETCL